MLRLMRPFDLPQTFPVTSSATDIIDITLIYLFCFYLFRSIHAC